MSKTYKIVLANEQIQKIYSISDKPATQSSLMSILSYLIKYTDETTNTLTKSLSKLYKMYLRYHSKITRSYFYTLIKKLKEKGLILIGVEDKKEDKKEDKENIAEPTENTNVQDNSEKPNNLMPNPNINTYTPYTTNVVNAVDLIDEVLKDLKIKSKIIKSMVIAKLQNTVLDAKGAINYIIRVITEKTEQYNSMRVEYAKVVAKTKYSKSKNTFVAPVKTIRTFNNFEARPEYSDPNYYKFLEENLL